MDSEIGVRDLADSFRYDVLPQIVKTMNWQKSRDLLDELPDYERLALLVFFPHPFQVPILLLTTKFSLGRKLSLISPCTGLTYRQESECRTQ